MCILVCTIRYDHVSSILVLCACTNNSLFDALEVQFLDANSQPHMKTI